VEKTHIIPVRAGHWSRLPNRDQLLGTNTGPGSSTNRDRWVSTWARAQRGGWIIGPGSWHEPGSLVYAFRAIFVQRQGFVFFFHLFIWFFVFNLMVLHIYSNNEGTTLYIYYTSWSRIYYTPSHPSCLVETY
jgi:hypothetical protein